MRRRRRRRRRRRSEEKESGRSRRGAIQHRSLLDSVRAAELSLLQEICSNLSSWSNPAAHTGVFHLPHLPALLVFVVFFLLYLGWPAETQELRPQKLGSSTLGSLCIARILRYECCRSFAVSHGWIRGGLAGSGSSLPITHVLHYSRRPLQGVLVS